MTPGSLPPREQVVQTILSGPACTVLVEGEERGNDAQILKVIFSSLGQSVVFVGRDGRDNLVRELPDLVAGLPAGKIAAIIDRDFMNDADVETTHSPDYTGHLYYWRRYCIENYLLEPDWIVSCMQTAHTLSPDRIPETLRTTGAVERHLLDWCRNVAPQVAGNWVIHELTQESDQKALDVPACVYFDDLTERSADWVSSRLTHSYGGWANTFPELFGENALANRYQARLKDVSAKMQNLQDAHSIVDGKRFLKHVILREVPPGLRRYFFSLLAELASKNPPADMRLLIEDRILPRWRKARAASQP